MHASGMWRTFYFFFSWRITPRNCFPMKPIWVAVPPACCSFHLKSSIKKKNATSINCAPRSASPPGLPHSQGRFKRVIFFCNHLKKKKFEIIAITITMRTKNPASQWSARAKSLSKVRSTRLTMFPASRGWRFAASDRCASLHTWPGSYDLARGRW
jgi:hypothetical protein